MNIYMSLVVTHIEQSKNIYFCNIISWIIKQVSYDPGLYGSYYNLPGHNAIENILLKKIEIFLFLSNQILFSYVLEFEFPVSW